MEKLNLLDTFLLDLYFYLTNNHPTEFQLKIFRLNNIKLNSNGDISCPINTAAWKKVCNTLDESQIRNKLNYFASHDFENTISLSNTWNISISKFSVVDDKLLIFLNRIKTFETVINCINTEKEKYGTHKFNFNSNIQLKTEHNSDILSEINLTQLRIKLIKDATENLLKLNTETDETKSEIIYLTNRSESDLKAKKILIGVVTSNKFGKKNTDVTAEDYYNKYAMDMRLMAQHRYGMRVDSEPGWANFFQTIGKAAVTIDLLHVKPKRPLVDNIDTPISSYKGSSFILYNCARIAEVLKQFHKKVEQNLYPQLPTIKDIDFSLLNQPEEWQLLYAYLLQYPKMITNCIQEINNCILNTHNLCIFLDSFCSLFSIYYRRVRILTDARPHMMPVLFSRIYLLNGIQQVLHNGLAILNIAPVKKM